MTSLSSKLLRFVFSHIRKSVKIETLVLAVQDYNTFIETKILLEFFKLPFGEPDAKALCFETAVKHVIAVCCSMLRSKCRYDKSL